MLVAGNNKDELSRRTLPSGACTATIGEAEPLLRLTFVLIVALLSFLGFPGNSLAAWSSPTNVSATGGSSYNPQIAMGPTGISTVAWYRNNGSNLIAQAAHIAADGTPGSPQDLSVAGQDALGPQVAVDPAGVSTVVWYRSNGSNTIVQAVRIAANGTVGAVQNLSAAGGSAYVPQVAVDPNGVSTVVWYRLTGGYFLVQGVRIAANGTVGSVQTLSAAAGTAKDPQVVVDANGVSTVTWFRSNGTNNIVQAVRIAANGTVGSVQDLSAAGQSAVDPQIAIDGSGVCTAIWVRFNGTDNIVQAVRIAADGTAGTVQDLSASGQAPTAPQVAVNASGLSTIVWHGHNGANYLVRAVRIAANGTSGTVQTLSAFGQETDYAQVAVAADGVSTVIWSRYNGTNYIAQAAFISANGTVGAAQDLSAVGRDGFSPQIAVDENGIFTSIWYRSNGSNTIVQASRASAAPEFSVLPASKAFGTHGTSSGPTATQDFVVTNTGSATLNITTVTKAGTDPTQFNVTADTCTAAAVAPAATCTVTANFDPSSAGAKSASLQFADDAAGTPHTVALTGTGTVAPAFSVLPVSKAFGSHAVAAGATATQDFVVTNGGDATLNITTVTKAGTDSTQFNVTADTCTAAAVAPAATCTVTANFDPSSAGAKSASLQFADDAAGTPHSIALTGTGTVAPAFSVLPVSKAFGSRAIAAGASTSQDFVVTNTGDATLNITTVTKAGTDSTQFNVTADTCNGAAVAPAATCTVTANFDPSSTGAKSASLQFADDAAGTPHSVALTGTGTAPVFSVLPTTKDFGSRAIGAGASTTQDFVVTNTGDATLNITTVTMASTDSTQFNVTADTCNGAAVAPAAICTVTASFDPSSTGAKSASLQFADDAAGTRHSIALTGTGTADPVDPPAIPPVITPLPLLKPVSTSPPKISGKKAVKKQLKATIGTWTGTDPIAYSYQWLRCDKRGKKCKSIKRATKGSYRLTKKDIGRRLKVNVIAKNAGGTNTATSKATTVVKKS